MSGVSASASAQNTASLGLNHRPLPMTILSVAIVPVSQRCFSIIGGDFVSGRGAAPPRSTARANCSGVAFGIARSFSGRLRFGFDPLLPPDCLDSVSQSSTS